MSDFILGILTGIIIFHVGKHIQSYLIERRIRKMAGELSVKLSESMKPLLRDLKRIQLETELQLAIEREDYEKAAEIRSELIKLQL